jgi:hypothetical protein
MDADEVMDQLLKDALAGDAPQLSRAFDDRVMRRVRPRRLTAGGRVVMCGYVLIVAVVAWWAMQDLPVASVAVAALVGVPVAAGAAAYGRHLAVGG